jgi:hypothetical protein
MRTYFRTGELMITEREVILLHKPRVRFAIAELDHVHTVRSRIGPGWARASHSAAGCAAVFATAVPATFNVPAAWLLAVLVLALSISSAGMFSRKYLRVWELRAMYRGMNVCLFSTTDVQTFGQVRRALIRALEANGKL